MQDPINQEESNAARILRLHGDDRQAELDEAAKAAEATYRKSSWIENFWFHHKWAVIMIGAFVLIFAIAAYQLIDRDRPDAIIMYAGPNYVGVAVTDELQPLMESMIRDGNDDGEKVVSIYAVVYAPEIADSSIAMKQFTSEFSAGDCTLYFLSPAMYEVALKTGCLLPLSEIFEGEIPVSANDDYSILLKDTPFYQNNTCVQALGEDTLVCLRSIPMLVNIRDKETAEERSETSRQFLISIVKGEIANTP